MDTRTILVYLLLVLFINLGDADRKSGYYSTDSSTGVLYSSTTSVSLLVDDAKNVTFYLSLPDELSATTSISVQFLFDNEGVIKPLPAAQISKEKNITVEIIPVKAGHVIITTNTSDANITTASTAFVRVDVMKSTVVDTISVVVGWIYFAAWSVSFYPQVIENFKRKSVIGLNFDFLALNIVGFTLYGTFNIGLFWIKPIQDEYFDKYPQGVNPVQANDVFFALHAVFACLVTISQCVVYQRGSQRVSRVCIGILVAIALFLTASIITSFTGKLSWLQFLYFCSYVKLGITLIKYIPQAYMNYRRKSTVGWSIGNIFLDFTGGALSILQMILISYNNDDWSSVFGDPTKFGLGLFSVLFDVLFIVQHYVLYRDNLPHQELEGIDGPFPHHSSEDIEDIKSD